MKHVLCFAVLFTIFTQVMAHAGELPGLRRAVEAVPQSTLSSEALASSGVVLSYVNMKAADLLRADRNDDASRISALNRLNVTEIAPSESLSLSTNNDKLPDWEQNAGVAIAGIDGFVGYGRAPAASTVWLMRKPSDAEGLFGRLMKRGFAPVGSGTAGSPVLTSPKIDFANARLHVFDPWISHLSPTPTVVARREADVIQASAPNQVDAWKSAMSASKRANAHPLIQVALHGLEAAIGEKAILVKTLFFSPMIGGDGADLIGSMTDELFGQAGPVKDPGALMKKLIDKRDKQMADAMPPYFLAVLADVETPGVDRGAVLAFVYPDCTSAKTGGERFVHRWKTVPIKRNGQGPTMADRAPSDIRTMAVQSKGIGCAAMITMTAAAPGRDDKLENQTYWTIFSSIMRREFFPGSF